MKAKSKLIRLKNATIEAYYKGMLPSALVSEINKIHVENGKYNASVDYVAFLKELTIDMLRVKGYYKNDIKERTGNNAVEFAISQYKEERGLNPNG